MLNNGRKYTKLRKQFQNRTREKNYNLCMEQKSRTFYISHWTALKAWEIPFIETFFASQLTDATRTECTVFKRKERFQDKKYKVHLCSRKPPPRATTVLRGEKIVTPEMLFLQLAQQFNMHQLIILGICMCSKDGPTTQKDLLKFVRRAFWHRGRRRALRALKYVTNSCRSHMEVMVFMFMRLPNLLGGCNFKTATTDHEIRIKEEYHKASERFRAFADIYFPDMKLVLEYDSFLQHNNASSFSRDEIRATALRMQNYTVVSMRPGQLYDKAPYELLIRYLAKLLGKRIRIRTQQYLPMYWALHAMLPRRKKAQTI